MVMYLTVIMTIMINKIYISQGKGKVLSIPVFQRLKVPTVVIAVMLPRLVLAPSTSFRVT